MCAHKPTLSEIHEELKLWQQGDCLIGSLPFITGYNPSLIISIESMNETNGNRGEIGFFQEEVAGLIIVTQTCDIQRDCNKVPYVDLSPLIKVQNEKIGLIKGRHMPGFAFITAFTNLTMIVCEYNDITAHQYLESVPLDLDGLSMEN